MTIHEKLRDLSACIEARQWAEGKTWKQIYNECERGDWLLWLFTKTNPSAKRKRVYVAAKCAETVKHLMKDERSLTALDMALKYGKGEATDKELRLAAASAYDAASDANAAVDAAAASASAAASAAASASAYASAYDAAYDANVAVDAAYAADAAYQKAKKKNQRHTADIVRELIPIEEFKI